MCSNSSHSRSAELVIQIKAPILKVPFTLVHRHWIWVNNSYWVSYNCTGGLLCSITCILSHKSQKNSVYPNPRTLIFSFSLRRWHIPPSHRSDLVLGPLTKQGGVEGQREWGRESKLGAFSAQIIIKKPARHGGGGGGGRSLFSGGLVFLHIGGWIDRKTAWARDCFSWQG